MKIGVSIFLALATVCFHADAQPRVQPVKKWEVVDIPFKSKHLPASINPFTVDFGAVVNGPENTRLKVPGFYNGDNEFVLRFSGNAEGVWTYETYSSVKDLSGLKGKVMVTASGPDRHGAVRVDPNSPQHFSYEDGSSYFALAFELDWLFALDYENKSDIPRTRQIISDVKNNGFNQVVMNVYAYDVGWKTDESVPAEYEYRRPSFFPFKGSNKNPDFSSLNIDFFKHLDRVIRHLDQQSVVAHLMIYVWNKKVSWPAMNTPADDMYFDYIIKRYQPFSNIIWDVSKEALDYGRCDIPYISERISRIRNLDAYHRLITVHDYEYCSREPGNVDFISIQSWRSDLYSLMLQARETHSDKPVMNIEHGGYEAGPYLSFYGNYTSPETCLVRNYESVFAGVYSTYYWQNTSWNIVVTDPFQNPSINPKPRYDYYKHLQGFFQRYDYNSLQPVRQKITTNSRIGIDNIATSGYALTNAKDLFIVLVPSTAEFSNLVIPAEGKKLRITWFNPFTGEYKVVGETPWRNWFEVHSPWPDTWSIVVAEAF